jgi:hypothetical protein
MEYLYITLLGETMFKGDLARFLPHTNNAVLRAFLKGQRGVAVFSGPVFFGRQGR